MEPANWQSELRAPYWAAAIALFVSLLGLCLAPLGIDGADLAPRRAVLLAFVLAVMGVHCATVAYARQRPGEPAHPACVCMYEGDVCIYAGEM